MDMAWTFLLLLLAHHSMASPHLASPSPPAIKAGYWPSWINFTSTSIHFPLFTHVYYAFVEPDPATYELAISADQAATLAKFSAAAHSHRPPVKAMMSIGGGDSTLQDTFVGLASSPSSRAAFINSSIAAARRLGLDGLDLDWEFPANATQMASLGELYTEWMAAAVAESARTGRPRLLLSSAVYFASHFFLPGSTPRSYPVAAMARGLDWANAMCYDYHGSWDPSETGEHAALYDPHSNISTSYGLRSWLSAGMPPEKVVMGLPLYGKTWRLKDPAEHGIGAPAAGVGPGNQGVMVYSAVVDFNKGRNATQVFDREVVAAYSFAGTTWIGYDDRRSVTEKIEFAKGMGIGGYFFWAIGYDKDWSISRRAWNAWGP